MIFRKIYYLIYAIIIFVVYDQILGVEPDSTNIQQVAFYENLTPSNLGIKNISFSQHFVIPNIKYSHYSAHKINPFNYKQKYDYLPLITGGYLSAGVVALMSRDNMWWSNRDAKFRVINDWNYALWLDKLGHFYSANILGEIISTGLDAGGVEPEMSVLISSSLAFSVLLYVEINDGFAPEWGFSPGDFSANVAGSLFFLAKYYYPVLNNFQLKWNYYPSHRNKIYPDKIFIDDYEGQKYWLSFKTKNLLPNELSEYFPSFLNIAIGVGAKNLTSLNKENLKPYREYYLAFDVDIKELPLHGRGWEAVKNLFNYIHLPMPGIKFNGSDTQIIFGIF